MEQNLPIEVILMQTSVNDTMGLLIYNHVNLNYNFKQLLEVEGFDVEDTWTKYFLFHDTPDYTEPKLLRLVNAYWRLKNQPIIRENPNLDELDKRIEYLLSRERDTNTFVMIIELIYQATGIIPKLDYDFSNTMLRKELRDVYTNYFSV